MAYDLIVVGAGPGGYVAALRAAELGLKVAVIEKGELGGTCLNVGCIPSKALLYSSHVYDEVSSHGKELGLEGGLEFSLQAMMERKGKIVSGFQKGIEMLLQKGKVDWLRGTASFVDKFTLQVDKEAVKGEFILLATGSTPTSLPFLPFDEKDILSSTGALSLSEVPKKLLVVGAGIIGVELGSVFARLGAKVEAIEFLDRICPTFDRSISQGLQKSLEKQGLSFSLSTKVNGMKRDGKEIVLVTEKGEFRGDKVLVSVGRRAYTEGLHLEKAGVAMTPKGQIGIDDCFRTNVPHIFAIGDVVDGPMLAHKASEEGRAVAELLAGKRAKLRYLAIPSIAYTAPEAAAVGLTEEEAANKKIPVSIASVPFSYNSRARCSGAVEGFVKIIVHRETRAVLGVHILGANASEMIHGPTMAVAEGKGIDSLAHIPYAHPTLAETIQECAFQLM